MGSSDGPWEKNYPKCFTLNKISNIRTSKTFCRTSNPQVSNAFVKKKRNQKNQDVIWARVSGQDTSSQFISRLVTTSKKKKQHDYREIEMDEKKDSTRGNR